MELKFHDCFYDIVLSDEDKPCMEFWKTRSHLKFWKNKHYWADKVLSLLDLGNLKFHEGRMTCFDRCIVWT